MKTNKCVGSTCQPATVLVVDADAVFREFEARTLTDRGYNVLKASGRKEALRLARRSPNIGLLLHGSPIHEPDTLDLTQQFQRAHPGAPVLLLLWSLEGFNERFNDLGRVGVMAKPFELKELINNVHQLLAGVHRSSVDNHGGQTVSRAVSPIPRRVSGDAKEQRSHIAKRANRLEGYFERTAFPS